MSNVIAGFMHCQGAGYATHGIPSNTSALIPANVGWGAATPNFNAADISAMETGIGRHLDFVEGYGDWNNGTSAWPTPYDPSFAGNRPIVWTVQPSSINGYKVTPTSECVQWQNLIAGDYDSEIETFGAWVQANITAPAFYVRFAHEMNATGWYEWQVGGACGVTSGANYAAGFNHVANILHNYPLIKMIFSCTPGTNISSFYPSTCDIIGFDNYNYIGANIWDTDDQIFAPTYAQLIALDPTKPIWINETSCEDQAAWVYQGVTYGPYSETKSGWVETFFSSGSYPRLAAVTWFNIQEERNWLWNSSADAIAGFQAAFSAFTASQGSTLWNPATGAIAGGEAPANAIFFDDFNGPAGSAPSSANWGIDAGSDPTSTASHYVNSRTNVYLDGSSHLVLATTAGTGGYSMNSGRVATWNDIGENSLASPTFSATWGTFSARIKCAGVTGYWPAWWAYGTTKPWPTGGEIDCLETFGGAFTVPLNTSGAGIHGGTGTGNNERSLSGASCTTIGDGQFHVYSWIIPADYSSITFQVDGVNMAVNVAYNPMNEADWVAHATQGGGGGPVVGATSADWPVGPSFPYGLVLNVSTNAGGVGPVDPSSTQTIMIVDWVKVTQP